MNVKSMLNVQSVKCSLIYDFYVGKARNALHKCINEGVFAVKVRSSSFFPTHVYNNTLRAKGLMGL